MAKQVQQNKSNVSKHRNIEISKYRDNENNEKTMSYINIIKNGIVKENPTFVLMLGMCPTLATTTSAMNGMSMGLATMAVLICTNFVISCLKSITPDKVRIPVFIVVIAAFVTILQLVIKAFLPDIDAALGLFIPLIVVNCVILGRAEAFAAKNSPYAGSHPARHLS